MRRIFILAAVAAAGLGAFAFQPAQADVCLTADVTINGENTLVDECVSTEAPAAPELPALP